MTLSKHVYTDEEIKKLIPSIVKKIYIFMDKDLIDGPSPLEYICPISHDSVVREMKNGTKIIYTHDPSFFQFDILAKGYDVIIIRGNKGIVLSELLDSGKSEKYTDKHMRFGNNTYKMFMAGAFAMVPMEEINSNKRKKKSWFYRIISKYLL
jgi:hypothetical protein